MIITRKYALRLVKQGRANVDGDVIHEGKRYAIITRYDLQRTDHYIKGDA
jgi:hypothetical protein